MNKIDQNATYSKLVVNVANTIRAKFPREFDSEDILVAADELITNYGKSATRQTIKIFKTTSIYQNRDTFSILSSSPFSVCEDYRRDDCDDGFENWLLKDNLRDRK